MIANEALEVFLVELSHWLGRKLMRIAVASGNEVMSPT